MLPIRRPERLELGCMDNDWDVVQARAHGGGGNRKMGLGVSHSTGTSPKLSHL